MVSDVDEGFYWFIILIDVILLISYYYSLKKHRTDEGCIWLHSCCISMYILLMLTSLVVYFSRGNDTDMRVAFYAACLPVFMTLFMVSVFVIIIGFYLCLGFTAYLCTPICDCSLLICNRCDISHQQNNLLYEKCSSIANWCQNSKRWLRYTLCEEQINIVDYDNEEHY